MVLISTIFLHRLHIYIFNTPLKAWSIVLSVDSIYYNCPPLPCHYLPWSPWNSLFYFLFSYRFHFIRHHQIFITGVILVLGNSSANRLTVYMNYKHWQTVLLMTFHSKFSTDGNDILLSINFRVFYCYKILYMSWQHSCHEMCKLL